MSDNSPNNDDHGENHIGNNQDTPNAQEAD